MIQLGTIDIFFSPLLDLGTSAWSALGLRLVQHPFTVLDQVGLVSHLPAHVTAQEFHISAKDQAARVRFRCNSDRTENHHQ